MRKDNATICTFVCTTCKLPITKELRPINPGFKYGYTSATPLIPEGYFGDSKSIAADYSTIQEEEILVNLKDLINTIEGPNRNGCCGADGMDGFNLLCTNEHAIGTEVSDCWTTHFAHLPLLFVERVSLNFNPD